MLRTNPPHQEQTITCISTPAGDTLGTDRHRTLFHMLELVLLTPVVQALLCITSLLHHWWLRHCLTNSHLPLLFYCSPIRPHPLVVSNAHPGRRSRTTISYMSSPIGGHHTMDQQALPGTWLPCLPLATHTATASVCALKSTVNDNKAVTLWGLCLPASNALHLVVWVQGHFEDLS